MKRPTSVAQPGGRRPPVDDPNSGWQAEAACRGVQADVFFPPTEEGASAAKRMCRMCPVTERCLAYALANGERYGVWGGLTAAERHGLSREDRARAVAVATGPAA